MLKYILKKSTALYIKKLKKTDRVFIQRVTQRGYLHSFEQVTVKKQKEGTNQQGHFRQATQAGRNKWVTIKHEFNWGNAIMSFTGSNLQDLIKPYSVPFQSIQRFFWLLGSVGCSCVPISPLLFFFFFPSSFNDAVVYCPHHKL